MASIVVPGGRRRWDSEGDIGRAERELEQARRENGPLACEDQPDRWFVDESCEADVAEVKAACESCPARLPCLRLAVARGEKFGVWGGLTATERGTGRGTAAAREPAELLPFYARPALAVASA